MHDLRQLTLTALLALAVAASAAPAAARIVPAYSKAEKTWIGAGAPASAVSTGKWGVGKRGVTVLDFQGAKRAYWFPRDHAAFQDGIARLRLHTGRRMDAMLVVRGRFPADTPSAVSGYGVELRRNRVHLLRFTNGVPRRIASERVNLRKHRRVEVVVLTSGEYLIVQVHNARTGSHLRSLVAKVKVASGRVGLVFGKKHSASLGVSLLSARPACRGGIGSARLGPERFLTLAQADEAKLPADARARFSELERLGRKSPKVVFRTDTVGLERLGCGGVKPLDVSVETPWKYFDDVYRRKRNQRPVRTATGFRVADTYKNPRMTQRLLKAYAKRFPENTRLLKLTRSRRGRPVMALAISRDIANSHGKPTVLLNGVHHGNEILSAEFVWDAIRMLLERSDDPRVSRWLDELVVWCVPMVNPDGAHAFLEHTKRTGRKNGRDNDGNGRRDRLDGVDLNRNYPFRWHSLGEKGSHSGKTSSWYRGPKPASEPETSAMIRLANAEHFVASVTYHTGTVAILAPYTIDNVRNPTPRNEAWTIAEEIVKRLPDHPDGRRYEVRRNLYSVDGVDQDWHRHAHGTLALLIEGARTSPKSMKHRTKIVDASRPIWTYLLDRYLNGPSIHGAVVDSAGRPVAAKVDVVEVKTHENERWMSRCRDGRYDRYLARSGRYTIRITVDGHEPISKVVDVRRKRVRVDFKLDFEVPDAGAACEGPVAGTTQAPAGEARGQ